MAYAVGDIALGSYPVLEVLAPQAVGALYRAQPREGDPVLLLTIDPTLTPDGATRQSLVKTVRLARGLRVPALARLVDARLDGETVVIIAQSASGETLRDRLARQAGPYSPSQAWALLEPVAAAVRAMHSEGEVLGDLRAETVLLTPDGVKLFNHGVGMALSRERFLEAMTRSGDLAGVAPEVRAGRTAGVVADVFALGAIAYQLFFAARPPLDGAVDGASPLGRALGRALGPGQHERPLTVEAFCREMEEALAELPPEPVEKSIEVLDDDFEETVDDGFNEPGTTREFNPREILDQDGLTTRQISREQLEELRARSRKG
jgi:serine/threonine protein kinase